ncbi:hypothetical protein AX15_005330 [Amanita polypyramis BW_CC]|nr:hypothetical protein AX15_005330 [Amanita polypyramis BW_CC]
MGSRCCHVRREILISFPSCLVLTQYGFSSVSCLHCGTNTCILNKTSRHARDNKLHVWDLIEESPASMRIGSIAALVDLPTPVLKYSLNVNALNFCRFSLLRLPEPVSSDLHSDRDQGQIQSLIAVPNLIESGAADIWSLHDCDRIHAAIGQELTKMEVHGSEFKGRNTYGIIMSLHLYLGGEGTELGSEASLSLSLPAINLRLRLLCAYENGSVVLWRYTRKDRVKSVEGQGWEMVWKVKLHAESVMAMRVSRTNDFALTVSVDHLVGWYDLTDETVDPEKRCVIYRTKHPGNGSVAIHDEGRVCAVGGWDGRIRLYSTKSFKPLGTLRYHKMACQTVEFTRTSYYPGTNAVNEEEDGDEDEKDKEKRSRWFVCGGKDHRVSIWELMDFSGKHRERDAKGGDNQH